jgi:Holliday junction resolvase RusA-like endonuclease
MTALKFWNDDAQVAQEIIEKFWADLPGIYIRITKLD